MTVGELIEKLSKLPPSTLVVGQSEHSYEPYVSAYLMRANVTRLPRLLDVDEDNGRDDVEQVVLITHYGWRENVEEL